MVTERLLEEVGFECHLKDESKRRLPRRMEYQSSGSGCKEYFQGPSLLHLLFRLLLAGCSAQGHMSPVLGNGSVGNV